MAINCAFLFLFLCVVAAIPSLPLQTDTPPTQIELRAATTTTAPALNTGLCGWLGGNSAVPWTCVVPGVCVVDPDPTINAIGCCPSSSCAIFRTACIPASQACGAACSSNKNNLICGTANPLCATFTYPGNYTEVRCTSSVPSELEVKFTFSGFPTPLPLPRLVTTLTSCDSTDRCEAGLQIKTQTPNLSSTTGRTSSTSGNPPTSTSGSPSSGEGSNHTGAIAGGVVGGVAVIAMAAVAIFFFYFRQKGGARAHFMKQGSGTPDSNRYYPRTPGEELGVIQDSLTKVHEIPASPVPGRSEIDGFEQQQRPLMELEANETEMRPLRPSGDNLPQRIE